MTCARLSAFWSIQARAYSQSMLFRALTAIRLPTSSDALLIGEFCRYHHPTKVRRLGSSQSYWSNDPNLQPLVHCQGSRDDIVNTTSTSPAASAVNPWAPPTVGFTSISSPNSLKYPNVRAANRGAASMIGIILTLTLVSSCDALGWLVIASIRSVKAPVKIFITVGKGLLIAHLIPD